MTEEFACHGSVAASPIDLDDESTFSLNTTHLSLPDSFDDTLCVSLYKRKFQANIKPGPEHVDTSHKNYKHQGNETRNDFQSDVKCTCELLQASEAHSRADTCIGNIDEESVCGHLQDGLQAKIRELYALNLELKEKARLYDNLKIRSSAYSAEVLELKKESEKQSTLLEESVQREKELRHQVLECTKNVSVANMDLEHARKEASIHLARADKAEKECEMKASQLDKYQSSLSNLNKEREEIKMKHEQEIARIREDCDKKLARIQNQQDESHSRESKLLAQARDDAIEQVQKLQGELKIISKEKTTYEAENSGLVKELEVQLADVRSDLKVKAYELNTLHACHDRVVAEVEHTKAQDEKTKEALTTLQISYAKLERETTLQIHKLQAEINHKEKELELCRSDNLLFCSDCNENDLDDLGMVSGRKALVKNSVALARKCRELQLLSKRLATELESEKTKNESLAASEASNQRLLQELSVQKNASAYVVSVVNSRDRQIQELRSNIYSLQIDLENANHERENLRSNLCQVLERRGQLDEMKELVEVMKSSVSLPGKKASIEGITDDDKLTDVLDDHDDLTDHMIYHKDCNT